VWHDGQRDDRDRSRRHDAEDRRWSSTGWILGDRTIEMSSNIVRDLHHAQGHKERRFLSLVSKSRSMVSPGLASKPVVMILVV
jgi:hypothetical protein